MEPFNSLLKSRLKTFLFNQLLLNQKSDLAGASEVTTMWCCRNLIIIMIIIKVPLCLGMFRALNEGVHSV